MRHLYFLFLFFLSTSIHSQSKLTSKEWQEDLRFLQQKIHTDYQPLFYKITKQDFDKAVDNLFDRIPNMEDHEVMVGIAEIIASFKYGHTALWLTAWRYNQLVDFHQMPYNLYQFSDGIYIQGTHKDYEQALGAKVLRVGNKSIEEALEAIKPVVSAENDQFFKAHGLSYLGVPEVLHAKGVIEETSTVTLKVEKDGNQHDITFTPRESETFPGHYSFIQTQGNWLDARPSETTPLWLKNLNKKYYFEYLPDNKTAYVRQSEVQDDEETIPEFYARVFDFIENNEVEKLVIDLRLNSGGNNYKNKPVITGLIKCDKINQPGKLFVILGRRTFSACQNLVNELENYTQATFIGEPTAENVNFFGDSRIERLPHSNLPIRLSYLWWQNKDPRDTRPWTPPHIAVELSSADYFNNHDPILDLILSTSEVTLPIEPWSHLADLFMQGKITELKTKAHEYVKDPTYQYYDFEKRINDAGYQLIGAESFQEALVVLNLNAELFPQSANTWDSLAEAYWKNGNKIKAIENYKKAISLDSEGPTGEHARKMIERIEKEN